MNLASIAFAENWRSDSRIFAKVHARSIMYETSGGAI